MSSSRMPTRSLLTGEVPKLRPCLGPCSPPHLILSTKATRICDAGRHAVEGLDEWMLLGGYAVRGRRTERPSAGLLSEAVEA